MTTTLVVEPGPFAWTLARVDAGALREVRVVDRLGGVEEGLFRARLTRLVPDLGGAFVDVGDVPMLARLPAAVRRTRPAEGSWLLVQGTRDATSDKPPRGTTSWRVPGRWLALRGQPGAPAVDETVQGAMRRRLLERAMRLFRDLPVTLRATAEGATDADLVAEAAALQRLAEAWQARAAELRAPGAVTTFEERLAGVRALLGVDPAAPLIAPRGSRLLVARRLGVPAEQVTPADDPWAEAGAAEAWAAAHTATVPFGEGARLHVEPTRALVAVDVDRGASQASALDVDRQAALALAAAIGIRQLGGQIVVDFLEPRASEVAALEASVRSALDGTGARLVALLASGLAVAERPRRTAALHERADPRRTSATALLQEVATDPLATFRLAPDLAAFLDEPKVRPLVAAWLEGCAAAPTFVRDATLPPLTFVRS